MAIEVSTSVTTQWTFVLALTALFLSAVVVLQILSQYAKAYMVAPAEVLNFVDAADSSVQENESYDRDVSRVQRLDDKLRLGRLLREIQRVGDDLREELSAMLLSEPGGVGSDGMSDLDLRLKATARVLWASKRKGLEDKVRRLDMLRMRFLVVYLGIVANSGLEKNLEKNQEKKTPNKNPEKIGNRLFEDEFAARPQLNRALTEGIKKKPVLRRLSVAQGHSDNVKPGPKVGWGNVMRELQLSPLLHKRHASIEKAMSSPGSS
ncbi:hypothetical protein J7T55_013338 [Diaporthe amygdali]|uniref:uncharacterized protein n=1 Tax=Phomopsis amygdali TaxID=1214568 RepID=UPI0022FE89D5|nr:uncharacterized protein J7T55_013338 [Diaporthe amygdali]KAJ0119103.1 hypothetical protein J7T55_013338 [Diaporthe amygdali]